MQHSVNLIIAKEYFGKLTENEKLLFYKDVDQQLNTTQQNKEKNATKTHLKRKKTIRSEFTEEFFFKELCNTHNEKVKNRKKRKKNK